MGSLTRGHVYSVEGRLLRFLGKGKRGMGVFLETCIKPRSVHLPIRPLALAFTPEQWVEHVRRGFAAEPRLPAINE